MVLIMNLGGMTTGSMQGFHTKLPVQYDIYYMHTQSELLSDALLCSFPASTSIRVLLQETLLL
jgi:hypothetical protein